MMHIMSRSKYSDNTIPRITNLANIASLNAKINEVKGKILILLT